MRKLMTVALLIATTGQAMASHAMTQAEFRQVLHERDVAAARAWASVAREQALEQARGERDRADAEARERDYCFALGVMGETGTSPEFHRQQKLLSAEWEHIRPIEGDLACDGSGYVRSADYYRNRRLFTAWVRHAQAIERIRRGWKAAGNSLQR